MVAIFLARVRRAISGRMPLAHDRIVALGASCRLSAERVAGDVREVRVNQS
jgi:hypothetical protein